MLNRAGPLLCTIFHAREPADPEVEGIRWTTSLTSTLSLIDI